MSRTANIAATSSNEVLSWLATELVTVKPGLRAEDIRPDSSLTADLGFDSMDLVKLANRLREERPDFELSRWLAKAMESDQDSVASIAALLEEAGVPHV